VRKSVPPSVAPFALELELVPLPVEPVPDVPFVPVPAPGWVVA
jgi:hypothetical protein